MFQLGIGLIPGAVTSLVSYSAVCYFSPKEKNDFESSILDTPAPIISAVSAIAAIVLSILFVPIAVKSSPVMLSFYLLTSASGSLAGAIYPMIR